MAINSFSGAYSIPMSIIDAKGDLIVGSAADTAVRKAIGTDGQFLQADSASTGGVKWATAASGGMTLLSSGNITTGATTFTLSSIDQTYTDLRLVVRNFRTQTAGNNFTIRFNSNSGSVYLQDTSSNSAANMATSMISSGVAAITNMRSASTITIQNYTKTDNRTVLANAWSWNGTNYDTRIVLGAFYDTTAISSVNLIAGGGETWQGGTYELWGIK